MRLINPRTGVLLREHLRTHRGFHRIEERDQFPRTPRTTPALLRRAHSRHQSRHALRADPSHRSIGVLEHCVRSVIEVRRYLTSEIQLLTEGDLCSSLRAMRAACRKFLEAVDDQDGIVVRHGGHPGHWASWRFGGALGELRGVFGVHIARIAAQNGLDIEDDRARILPASDAENDGHPGRKSARKRPDHDRD